VASSRRQRHFARLTAVQALYQIEVNRQAPGVVVQEFKEFRLNDFSTREGGKSVDEILFSEIVSKAGEEMADLDRQIQKVLAGGWMVSRLDPTSRALLRAACYELDKKGSVPARVIIKEYVDISGGFSGKEETAFVNAALDTLARELRSNEMLDKKD
jgi:N utilization substance protein B